MAGARVSSRMRWSVMAAVAVVVTSWIAATHRLSIAAAQGRPESSEKKPLVLDRAPARNISDPNPVFRAMAIDAEGGEIFMANDKESAGASILVYPTQFAPTERIIEPLRRIAGPKTDLGMVCGVAISVKHSELYSVSGESGTLNAFSLKANGDVPPERELDGTTPRASAGVFLDEENDEVYTTTEHVNRVNAFRRTFEEDDEPLRYIQGPNTGLADPHGVYVDSATNEIFVTNHGNWHEVVTGEGERRGPDSLTRTSLGYGEPGKVLPLAPSTGKFLGSSITIYSRTAQGDAKALRVIHGAQTQLNLPDGVYRDPVSGEIIVANTGADSVLFFAKDANGDVAPTRVLKGSNTRLKGPVGVSIDPKHNELWVASWDNHIAAVFPRTVKGNVAPLRVIRSAGDNAPLASMGRIGAVAYDPKRNEILAPNCVSQPRISVYSNSANGNAVPTRVIQGAKTLQARTSHYIAIDSVHDEIVVPNPFAQAILFLPGGANGDQSPLRIIQGPKTLLNAPDNVAVDPIHKEIYTASFPTDAILVYKSDVAGDVAPIRIIRGPKTQLDRPIRIEVDPINNIIAVVNDHNYTLYNRTDNGDVAPKWMLGGNKISVGGSNNTRDLKLYPEGKLIIGGGIMRPQEPAAAGEGRGGRFGRGQAFLGAWRYGDTGDAVPFAVLNSTPVTKIPGSRLAINPAGGDLIVGGDGQVSVYHLPEMFQKAN